MARKPSFEFERRERTKEKAAKRAEKAVAKSEKKTTASAEDAVAVQNAGSKNGDDP